MKVKRVPQSAAVREVSGSDSIASVEYWRLPCSGTADCSPYVVPGSPPSDGSSRVSSVSVMSGSQRLDWQRGADRLLEWESIRTFYSMRCSVVRDASGLDALSKLLEQMLIAGAIDGQDASEHSDHRVPQKFAAHEPEVIIMAELVRLGLARQNDGVGKFDYHLTQDGLHQVVFGVQIANPRPVLRPLPGVPVKDMSTLHALQQLLADGWQWQLAEKKKQMEATPYRAKSPKLFYTAGVEVIPQYLHALLSADELFARGLLAIPHGHAASEYQAVLDGNGKFSPQPLAKDNGPLLEVDGVGSLQLVVAPRARAPVASSTGAAPSAVAGSLAGLRPKHFERQIGAMCGMRALNNVLGSITHKQTFRVRDVADAVQTLQEEYIRDGLPWRCQDHVSPSGDYSLALLQWMLQRHSVQCEPGDLFSSRPTWQI